MSLPKPTAQSAVVGYTFRDLCSEDFRRASLI